MGKQAVSHWATFIPVEVFETASTVVMVVLSCGCTGVRW